jgi:DNA-binding response OmpR family regulator
LIGVRLDGVRVLVVDDDPDTLEMMALLLQLQGADVVQASGADEALRQYSCRPPHVLVSDLAMRGHDGLWLIREVRRLGGLDGLRVPAIAVFDAYFTKPIDPDALFGAVGSAVRRTA